MQKLSYIKLSNEQIDKVGNSIIYFSERISGLSKTKALKLIYILDELSIKKSGIPFFNLKYKVWKFGPVSEEIFIDLSSEVTLLKNYIKRTSEEGTTMIEPLVKFNDDEFSDNDIDLLEFVIGEFGNKTTKELVYYTHRANSPWHKTAKENSVLDLLEKEVINNTEILIDMSSLINHDERKKDIYLDFIESN
ncbi:Panacea domain-containing protein [Brumimicrobium oceani]|uniref:Antitoxin SocA-like Panacea domain-containing protein n=1 Tax=Brumimicrobium oceani TaxID=2100725 RepID=A0A2U2XAC0_9FLAO|nr:Panacea domain-containing protein [Brumimicrobium oceani]PWH84749.1 hypothetical protein DIT68_12525 [Brumimicrobium oceani]